ncbi:MAG: hypothetical protein AAF206_13170, partial [Bacteroidota bacterium]
MEQNPFYSKFQKKTEAELRSMLDEPDSYQAAAVLAAAGILEERKLVLSETQQKTLLRLERLAERKAAAQPDDL